MNPYEPIYDEYGEYIKEYYFDPFDPSGSEKKIENPLYNATLSSFSKNQSRNMKNSVMIRWDIVPQFYVTGQINYSSDYSQSDVYVSPDDSQYLSTVNPAEKGSYTISEQIIRHGTENLQPVIENSLRMSGFLLMQVVQVYLINTPAIFLRKGSGL